MALGGGLGVAVPCQNGEAANGDPDLRDLSVDPKVKKISIRKLSTRN